MNMEELFNEIITWQKETFGEGRPALFPANHLQKEVGELIEVLTIDNTVGSPNNRSTALDADIKKEIADCFILLFNLCSNYGLGFNDIIKVIRTKFDIIQKRKWGKPDDKGIIEHTEGE